MLSCVSLDHLHVPLSEWSLADDLPDPGPLLGILVHARDHDPEELLVHGDVLSHKTPKELLSTLRVAKNFLRAFSARFVTIREGKPLEENCEHRNSECEDVSSLNRVGL